MFGEREARFERLIRVNGASMDSEPANIVSQLWLVGKTWLVSQLWLVGKFVSLMLSEPGGKHISEHGSKHKMRAVARMG